MSSVIVEHILEEVKRLTSEEQRELREFSRESHHLLKWTTTHEQDSAWQQ